MHNGPFDELINFDISGLIFQAEVTKFDIHVGLNILINMSCEFYQPPPPPKKKKKKKKVPKTFIVLRPQRSLIMEVYVSLNMPIKGYLMSCLVMENLGLFFKSSDFVQMKGYTC